MNKQDNYFLNDPEVFSFFVNRKETEFYISTMGYHNFHFVTPEPYMRKQNYLTLHFVISGKGVLVVNGKKYTVSQHEMFFLDDKSIFAYYPDRNEPWEYVFFEFGGKLAKDYAHSVGLSDETPIKPCLKPLKMITILKDAFLKDNSMNNPSYFSVVSAFFSLLDFSVVTKNNTQFFYENDFIEEVKNFIKIRYLSPDFDIPYLCKAMNISHSHLCRIFKQKEGISLIAYIRNLKIEKAEELLKNPSLTLKEIAVMSGLSDYEYFLRLFKSIHGITPTEYRKNLQP